MYQHVDGIDSAQTGTAQLYGAARRSADGMGSPSRMFGILGMFGMVGLVCMVLYGMFGGILGMFVMVCMVCVVSVVSVVSVVCVVCVVYMVRVVCIKGMYAADPRATEATRGTARARAAGPRGQSHSMIDTYVII